jgi:alanyl-tRNA synthetase
LPEDYRHSPVTQRLYYRDSYLTTFEAVVVDRAGEGRRVYLDRTAFYPTSGGQPHDTGRLGGAEVLGVEDEGERIAHLLSAPLDGSRVTGVVDWTRRFDHMQQHTGQHLLSAVLAELFGVATVSVHFGADDSTLDLDAASIDPAQMAAAETRANEVAAENRPVSVGFEDAATASGLRKASEREGSLRIVSIRDLDRSACGGTHVRATGEIGAILIRKAERVRKTVRLEFLCGLRAVRRARLDHELLTRLAAHCSARPEELPALIEAQRTELKEASAARRYAEAELDRYRAAELLAAVVPDDAGVRQVLVRVEQGSAERLRGLAQAAAALPRAVFIGVVASPPMIVVAAAEDSGRDAAAMLKRILAPAGGRGGGTQRLAQGTLPPEHLETAVAGIGGVAAAEVPWLRS